MADMYVAGGSASVISASVRSDGSNDPKHHDSFTAEDGTQMSAAQVTRRLAGYIAPHVTLFLLSLLGSVVTMVLQLWVPIIVGSAIDQLIHLVQGSEATLIPVLVKLALVVLCASVTQWIASWATNRLTYETTRAIRIAAHEKIARPRFPILTLMPKETLPPVWSTMLISWETVSCKVLLSFLPAWLLS